MTWEKPTEKFPTTEEAIRWFVKSHFTPTKDSDRKTWASDLYATYLDAAVTVELPIVSAVAFGSCVGTMLSSTHTGRREDGETRTGRLYDIEPLEGVAVFAVGRAGTRGVRDLYEKALRRVGASSAGSTTMDSLQRENEKLVATLARHGYLSTIPRGRKRAAVEEPVNEARVLEMPTTELFNAVEGAHTPGYIRWLALLKANFVTWRSNHGSRKMIVAVEKVTEAS